MQIPFNKPYIVGKELHYIAQAVQSGNLSGDGAFTELCSRWIEQTFGANRVLLVHSCTAALEMAAILCDCQEGDEVIVPSYTFVSTVNAFVLRGATPVFVDIHPNTMNMDEYLLESLITEKTKVICPVHYAGVACEMDKIMQLAEEYDLLVVEDAAQGVCSRYKGRYLGTIGHLGCYSFHETKNFISGEGGALVINDDRFAARAEVVREKGTNRSQFFRGEVDKYTWTDLGSSYLASELTAAFLYGQLKESELITQKRNKIWKTYYDGLKPLESGGKIRLPQVPPHCEHNGHMFFMILNSQGERQELIAFLRARGIHAIFHYIPLHSSPMGQKLAAEEGALPVTENLAERVLRLPVFFELTLDDQHEVITALHDFFD